MKGIGIELWTIVHPFCPRGIHKQKSDIFIQTWCFIVLFSILQSFEYWGPIKECIFEFLSLAAIGHVNGWVWRLEEEALKLKVHKRSKMTFDSAFSTSFRAWNIEVPLWSVFLNFFILRQVDKAEVGSEDLRGKPVIQRFINTSLLLVYFKYF